MDSYDNSKPIFTCLQKDFADGKAEKELLPELLEPLYISTSPSNHWPRKRKGTPSVKERLSLQHATSEPRRQTVPYSPRFSHSGSIPGIRRSSCDEIPCLCCPCRSAAYIESQRRSGGIYKLSCRTHRLELTRSSIERDMRT